MKPRAHAFSCRRCSQSVASSRSIISKSFHGRTGRAYLIHTMHNIHLGDQEERMLMTGMHRVANVTCAECNFVLGWKYAFAQEASQKYKEGKYVVEKATIECHALL